LERQDHAQGTVFEWQINCVAGHPDWCSGETPAVHEGDAVAQGVGRDIQGESFSSKIVSKQVAGVPGVRAYFQKRRHFANELGMISNNSSAANIFLRVHFNSPFRLAERCKVVKFDLGALYRKRLCVVRRDRHETL